MSDAAARPAAERLRLLDVLASGDEQNWPKLFESVHQQQIAETMYGRQADELLASSWLAEFVSSAVRVALDAKADEIDGFREFWGYPGSMVVDWVVDTLRSGDNATAARLAAIKTSCAICGDPTHSTERHEETLDADFRVRVALDEEMAAYDSEINNVKASILAQQNEGYSDPFGHGWLGALKHMQSRLAARLAVLEPNTERPSE